MVTLPKCMCKLSHFCCLLADLQLAGHRWFPSLDCFGTILGSPFHEDIDPANITYLLYLLLTRVSLDRLTGKFPLPKDIMVKIACLPPPVSQVIAPMLCQPTRRALWTFWSVSCCREAWPSQPKPWHHFCSLSCQRTTCWWRLWWPVVAWGTSMQYTELVVETMDERWIPLRSLAWLHTSEICSRKKLHVMQCPCWTKLFVFFMSRGPDGI